MAGAGADRTHRGGNAAPNGFEDRGAHQIPFRPHMGAEGYLVSPAVFKTVGGGVPAPVRSIRTRPRH